MTESVDIKVKKITEYSEREKQLLPMPGEIDPNGVGYKTKLASALHKAKNRFSYKRKR